MYNVLMFFVDSDEFMVIYFFRTLAIGSVSEALIVKGIVK